MKRVLACTALALVAAPADANDWWVGGIGDSSLLLIDAASAKTFNNQVTLWSWRFLLRPTAEGVWSFKSQTRFDCAKATDETLYLVAYALDDTVVGSAAGEAGPSPVSASNAARVLFQQVCRGGLSASFAVSPDLYVRAWRRLNGAPAR